jgi:hypothetical protein
MQGKRDHVTFLEEEAGDLDPEVADCAAADTSSYLGVVLPSSVHRHQEAQHQHEAGMLLFSVLFFTVLIIMYR